MTTGWVWHSAVLLAQPCLREPSCSFTILGTESLNWLGSTGKLAICIAAVVMLVCPCVYLPVLLRFRRAGSRSLQEQQVHVKIGTQNFDNIPGTCALVESGRLLLENDDKNAAASPTIC